MSLEKEQTKREQGDHSNAEEEMDLKRYPTE